MKEQGFFKKFGLEPNIVSVGDGSKLMGAVIGGGSDIVVISGFSQVLAAIEKGAKIKLVAATRFLVDDVIYSKRPEIRRLKDLEGRTFGTGSPGALLHHMTVALMRKKGVDASKVRFVNIGSSTDVFRAVVAGTVDAGIALNDVYGHQEHYGVHALDDGLVYDELPEYTYQASYSSDRAIAGKRDLLVRTLAAYGTLWRFIAESGFQGRIRARPHRGDQQRDRRRGGRHRMGVRPEAQALRRRPRPVRGTRALHAADQFGTRTAEKDAALRAGGRYDLGAGRAKADGLVCCPRRMNLNTVIARLDRARPGDPVTTGLQSGAWHEFH